jgi:NCAIR mutase (PurE)-related protein
MNETKLRKLLKQFRQDNVSEDAIIEQLKEMPFESLGYAMIDHHRTLRQGFPEVIFCQGKTSEQVVEIAKRIVERNGKLLATRASHEVFDAVRAELPGAVYHEGARAITLQLPEPVETKKYALVVTAGTSDVPVAEEAVVTIRVMGYRAQQLYDVGVAGIHRLLAHRKMLDEASVIVVVAGMEGAMASVVGGLTNKLVIAVPTSVGYGSSFGGLAALLTMLNSCAAGVTVVNIDNGFGGGFAAALVMKALSVEES